MHADDGWAWPYTFPPIVYMKNFSQTHALQAVDLNSISNLYLVSLQPYVFRAEYGICNYGTKRRLGLSVYYMIGQGTSVIGQGIF